MYKSGYRALCSNKTAQYTVVGRRRGLGGVGRFFPKQFPLVHFLTDQNFIFVVKPALASVSWLTGFNYFGIYFAPLKINLSVCA